MASSIGRYCSLSKAKVFIFTGILCFFVAMTGCSGDKTESADADKTEIADLDKPPALPASDSGIVLSILPESPRAGDGLQVIIEGSNPNHIRYEWYLRGDPIPGATTERLEGVDLKKGDIVLVVANADGERVSVETEIVNTPPVIKSVTVEPRSISSGLDVSVSAVGEDLDGDLARFDYQWVINGEESLSNTLSSLKGNEFKRGDMISVIVGVSDYEAKGDPYTTPGFEVLNAVPKITSVPPKEFEGWDYSYQVLVADLDGDDIAFKLLLAPEGMKIDSSGMIAWKMKHGNAGNHSVEIEVDDGNGGVVTQRYEIVLGISGE